ncbi:MAG: NAD-dependent epimerase/dehydratase family protein, partial [bacterium]
MTKTMLVTGGSGFIGVPLCTTALTKGYSVCVLTRDAERAAKKLPEGVRLVESLQDLPADIHIDVVVNLAGEPLAQGRWNKKRKQQFYDSRVGTTQALFEHFKSRQQHPKIVINGSAIGYYGPNGGSVIDENGHYHQSFSHQLCHDWEQAAHRFEALGSRVCILRTGIVLGRGGGALSQMLLPFKLGLGGRI